VYRASDYDVGLAAISYSVVLTLYGPGGSYDTKNGTITRLSRSRDGARDTRAAHTVVNEIVHMGIEDTIVQRFHLPHDVKERLVDRICITYLGDTLVGYKAQPMGPVALDAYVDAHAVLELPNAVQAFVQANNPKATVDEARQRGTGAVIGARHHHATAALIQRPRTA
jgi:hypothetical protein